MSTGQLRQNAVRKEVCNQARGMQEELQSKMNRKKICKELQDKILLCESSTYDTLLKRKLQEIYRIDKRVFTKQYLQRTLVSVDEISRLIRMEYVNSARGKAEQLQKRLNRDTQEKEREGKALQLFRKIKKKRSSQDDQKTDMYEKTYQQTQTDVNRIQDKISALTDEWNQCYGELKEIVKKYREADGTRPIKNQYLVDIKTRQMKLKGLETQITHCLSVLESSTQYQTLLESGRQTLELKSILPNMEKAEAITEQIAEASEQVSEQILHLDKVVKDGSTRIIGTDVEIKDVDLDIDLMNQLESEDLSHADDSDPEGSHEEEGLADREHTGTKDYETV